MLVRAPVVMFAELKTEAGKVRPEQRDWLDALGRCEGVKASLWRPRDWPEVEDSRRGRGRNGSNPKRVHHGLWRSVPTDLGGTLINRQF